MAMFIIVAPSGSGKTSIMNYIQREITGMDYIGECISHTTRQPRDGEVNGETYYFSKKEEFEFMEFEEMFVESVEYGGNKYGMSKEEINKRLRMHKHIYIIAEFHGYQQLKELYPQAVGIFLHMSKEDCMANMLLRGDSIDKATLRINTYEDEIKNKKEFDYVVKNVRNRMYATANVILNIIKQYE